MARLFVDDADAESITANRHYLPAHTPLVRVGHMWYSVKIISVEFYDIQCLGTAWVGRKGGETLERLCVSLGIGTYV